MLVRAFQIQIDRYRPSGIFDYAVPAAAGLKPDIKYVLFFMQIVKAETVRQDKIIGENLLRRIGKPAIGTFLSDMLGDCKYHLFAYGRVNRQK